MLCECGCGQETAIFRGRSRRFIHGHHWSGRSRNNGRYKDRDGYILIYKPSHPFARKNGFVLEHRLIMEEYLGRHLEPDEIAHHIDEIKYHNDIENLELCLDSIHKSFSAENISPETREKRGSSMAKAWKEGRGPRR